MMKNEVGYQRAAPRLGRLFIVETVEFPLQLHCAFFNLAKDVTFIREKEIPYFIMSDRMDS